MTTANDLIYTAAKLIGAIQDGEALPAAVASSCLDRLNSMLDAWSIDRLLIYHVQQDSYSWPSNTQSRTIGPTGNFVASRPVKLERGSFFRDSSNQDFPVFVTEDRNAYDSIQVKSVTSTYPQMLFYDASFPNGTLYVYPKTSVALTLFLNYYGALQSFSSLTSSFSLPPGYKALIEYNLAIWCQPIFNLVVSQDDKEIAGKTLAAVKKINNPVQMAGTDLTTILKGVGRSNIFAGQ